MLALKVVSALAPGVVAAAAGALLFTKHRSSARHAFASRLPQPPEIHLERDEAIAWRNPHRAFGFGRELMAAGFQPAGQFRVRERRELFVAGMLHPLGLRAAVFDHPDLGVWCEVVAQRAAPDPGTGVHTITFTNAPTPIPGPPPPTHETCLHTHETPTQLVERIKSRVGGFALERSEPEHFAADFERAYRDELESTRRSAELASGEQLPPSKRLPERNAAADAACAPLFAALARGDGDAVLGALRGVAQLEGRDARGWTPLMRALERGDARLVDMLFKAGADPNAWAPGNPGDPRWPRDAGSVGPDAPGAAELVTPLVCAIASGDPQLVRRCVDAGASLSACHRLTPLQYAAQLGETESVRALLGLGADPNTAGRMGASALHAAAAAGCADVVQLLVERGADLERPNEAGETPIECAAAAGHAPIVAFLAARMKCRVVKHARRELKRALAVQQQIEQELAKKRGGIELGARVRPPTAVRRLHRAAASGSATLIRHVLAAGVAADAPESGYAGDPGPTPLFLAVQFGHLEALRALVAAGADPNRIARGDTPLLRALDPRCMADPGGRLTIIQCLIELGASPDLAPPGRPLPLVAALRSEAPGALETLRALLESGADPNRPGEDGRSAVQLAREEQRTEALALLAGRT